MEKDSITETSIWAVFKNWCANLCFFSAVFRCCCCCLLFLFCFTFHTSWCWFNTSESVLLPCKWRLNQRINARKNQPRLVLWAWSWSHDSSLTGAGTILLFYIVFLSQPVLRFCCSDDGDNGRSASAGDGRTSRRREATVISRTASVWNQLIVPIV